MSYGDQNLDGLCHIWYLRVSWLLRLRMPEKVSTAVTSYQRHYQAAIIAAFVSSSCQTRPLYQGINFSSPTHPCKVTATSFIGLQPQFWKSSGCQYSFTMRVFHTVLSGISGGVVWMQICWKHNIEQFVRTKFRVTAVPCYQYWRFTWLFSVLPGEYFEVCYLRFLSIIVSSS